MALAYVSVGSNIEPEVHIVRSLELLTKQVCVTAVSRFFRTEPIGRPDQAPYLNGAFELRTDIAVRDLSSQVLSPIEIRLGRVRTEDKYASRTLDLDLILYNDLETHSLPLRLPHPDIQRSFVAGPIHELLSRSDLEHPCQASMLKLLPTSGLDYAPGHVQVTFSAQLKDRLQSLQSGC